MSNPIILELPLDEAEALADHPARLRDVSDDPGAFWVHKVQAATDRLWAAIRGEGEKPARIARFERLEKILDVLDRDGGSVVIRCDHNIDDDVRDWSLMSMFGSEEEGSPMAGGSHIGAGDTLDECLESAVK